MICMVEFSYQRGFQQFQFRQAYEEIGSEFVEDLLKFFGRVCLVVWCMLLEQIKISKVDSICFPLCEV